MTLSVFNLYSVGIGPSSSHTVGPRRAAARFARHVRDNVNGRVGRITVNLYGSLGAPGRGHGSVEAVLLGLKGDNPESVDVDNGRQQVHRIRTERVLRLDARNRVGFDAETDLVLHRQRRLPAPPNGTRFEAFDRNAAVLTAKSYFSVGGGFVVEGDEHGQLPPSPETVPVASPFTSAAELLEHCTAEQPNISDVILCNETTWRPEHEISGRLLTIWDVMQQLVHSDLTSDGTLPGLDVVRCAPGLHRALVTREREGREPDRIDWLNLFALAVNEENAAGGRVVTAPTHGAAGIVPALRHYYVKFVAGASPEGVCRFLLTAAAIGMLVKLNASISGAEMGGQGEVGTACAMAAAGLCEVLGGTPEQVENAAEMGIEHNLGLTYDPIGGVAQIPCIQRNAIASVKSLKAGQLALHGDGRHKVSLDRAVATMEQTGRNMLSKYKKRPWAASLLMSLNVDQLPHECPAVLPQT